MNVCCNLSGDLIFGEGWLVTGQFCRKKTTRKLQLTQIQSHHICTWVSYRIDHCVQSCANNSPWPSKTNKKWKKKAQHAEAPRKLRENLSFSRSPNSHQNGIRNIQQIFPVPRWYHPPKKTCSLRFHVGWKIIIDHLRFQIDTSPPETNHWWHVPVVFVGLSWMRTGPCLGWHDFKKTHPKTSQCLTMFEHLWPKCSEVASDTCTEVFHGPDVLACLSMRTLSCNESTNTKDSSTCTSNKNLSKRPIGILRTASSCMAYCVSSGFSGLLHVDATCKKFCGDQNAWRARAELSHHKIALLQKLTVIPIKSRGSTQTPWTMNHEILVAKNERIPISCLVIQQSLKLTAVVFPLLFEQKSWDLNQRPQAASRKSFWSKSACMPLLKPTVDRRLKWGFFGPFGWW